ncbi:MAG TPA: UvrD-helicase domain-containing protein [Polyangiaceae bacterium]|jgi:DNA helicase-2/ATP-dependent DNA helicase PcrA|nr:UvrD-helicase domain-containing protein [Polyangiaceae bacterium]
MHLNPAQQDAVSHLDGPLVVFAGAGSGKTRVITYRIANLIASGARPHRILAVTFTNKAAGEMRARLAELTGEGIAQELWVGTYHAICCRLLRRYHKDVGLGRNFVIYDDGDQKSLMGRIIKERKLDDRVFVPKQVLGRIHKQKQEGREPSDLRNSTTFTQEMVELYEAYEAGLRSSNAVDFDDLILHVMRLAEDSASPAGEELRSKFDYVLVDEFQDTNQVQYRLLRAIASRTKNLCVVGDDDQSIYSWRGADVRNIRGFKRDFAGAKIVKLEQNYRSTGNIVKAALGVISSSPDREPKELWTASEAGEKVLLLTTKDEREEAERAAHFARAAIAAGIRADDIAIFYRINAQSRVIEEAFRTASIPYQIVGGMRFFERAEVKDALAYLRLLENPASDADFLRVINVPARGIGDKTIQLLLDTAIEQRCSLWTALGHALEGKALALAAKKRLHAFRELLNALFPLRDELGPLALMRELLERTGYTQALKTADTPEADARLENLAELSGSLADYEREAKAQGIEPSVSGYLERVSLVADIDGVQDQRTVLLMTVHAAKGLEFDTVVLTGMEEEMFPYRGMDGSSPEELEEERRLAYVAITRARRRLIVTNSQIRTIFGNTRYAVSSRFLRDIPKDALEHTAVTRSQPPSGNRWGGYGGAPAWRGGGAYAQRDEFDQRVDYDAQAAERRPNVNSSFRDSPSRQSAPAPASGRTIDYEAFGDADEPAVRVHKGSTVHHQRFGRGTVLEVVAGEQPRVLARFAGWGERKVLLTALTVE